MNSFCRSEGFTCPSLAVVVWLGLATPVWCDPPAKFVSDQDFIIAAAQEGFSEILKEFDATQPIERALITVALQGKVKGSSLLSITLVKPGKEAESFKKTFRKTLNEQFTLKMAKVTSPTVQRPIGLVHLSLIVEGRLAVEERMLVWEENQWREVAEEGQPMPKRQNP